MSQSDQELILVARTVARLRAAIVAVVTAMVAGFGLFAATLWLVIKGGPNVGQHLSLLRAYYPGYSVTWTGSLIGFSTSVGLPVATAASNGSVWAASSVEMMMASTSPLDTVAAMSVDQRSAPTSVASRSAAAGSRSTMARWATPACCAARRAR